MISFLSSTRGIFISLEHMKILTLVPENSSINRVSISCQVMSSKVVRDRLNEVIPSSEVASSSARRQEITSSRFA